jgi:hypothetical protein
MDDGIPASSSHSLIMFFLHEIPCGWKVANKIDILNVNENVIRYIMPMLNATKNIRDGYFRNMMFGLA